MERNTQRIDGTLTRLHHLSDEELEGEMGHAHLRVDRATHDLELLGMESARRFAVAEQLGETIVESNVVPLFDHPTLFDTDPAA